MVLVKKYLTSILLWILPLTFLLFGLSFDRAKYSNDPEYIYLINALSISKIRPVGHIDNPGTTVMEIGAVIINVAYFLSPSGGKDLMADVLKNPDRYIGILNGALIFIIAFILLWLGLIVVKKSQNLWAVLILQITPFLSITILEQAWTKVSPEPLLIFTSLFLSGILIIYYFDVNRNRRQYFLLFALISGFGLATKATFLPVAIIPFLLLPGFYRKSGYLFFVILFFVIFTLPAWPEYSNMYTWYYNLATHTGIYGSGNTGMIEASQYFVSFGKIIQNNVHFSILLVVSIFTVIYFFASSKHRQKVKTLRFRILISLVITNIAGILLVSKHYHANHYLVPELALSGLTIFFIIENVKDLITKKSIQKYAMPAIVGFLIVYLPVNNIPTLNNSNQGYRATNSEYEHTMKLIGENYGDYKCVYFYPVSLNKFSALMFGNSYSKRKNLNEIRTLYPETVFYDHTQSLFNIWGAQAGIEDIIKTFGNKILLVGGPISDESKDDSQKAAEITNSGFPIKPVYQGRTQAIWVFDTVAYQTIQKQQPVNSFELNLDMETPEDQQAYVSSGEHLFTVNNTRSSEMARSGRYSIKLDKNQQFSLDFILENSKPGDNYKIKIWRYSENNDGFLVASSNPSSLFYQQNCEAIKTDDTRWKLIQLIFTIPENIDNNPIKMYVWNSGSSEMYFDDLTIEKK